MFDLTGKKVLITLISLVSFSRSSLRPAFLYTSQDSFLCLIIFFKIAVISLSDISF